MTPEFLEEKIQPLFENSGFEIVDIKISGGNKFTIQIFIDKENGNVTLKDCEVWSDKVGAFIDMNEIITQAYILEVSSPGVDRIIKKEKDFKRFIGKEVKILLKRPLNGSKVYYSRIKGYENNRPIFEDGLDFEPEIIEEVRLNPNYEDLFKNIKG